jgi:hypothetical protein
MCRCCGEVTLPACLVRLVLSNVPERSVYSWRCPRCGEFHEMVATKRALAILRDAGVLAEPWHIPQEALEPHTGPPLDDDDLIAFLRALERFHVVDDAPCLIAVPAAAPAPPPDPAGATDRLLDVLRSLGSGRVPPHQRR